MKKNENLYKIALGENIRKIRRKLKLTQDMFSEIIGIEPSSLSNIENGKSFPSTFTVIQIQEKFKINAEEIFDIAHLSAPVKIDEDICEKVKNASSKEKMVIWKIVNLLNI